MSREIFLQGEPTPSRFPPEQNYESITTTVAFEHVHVLWGMGGVSPKENSPGSFVTLC